MPENKMYLKRLTPQFSINTAGKVSWKPGLIDYNPNIFYRGKTVTNDEFNNLFMRQGTQSNYTADSLAELINNKLATIIRRQVSNDFNLVTSYIKVFTQETWGTLQADGYYYISIPATEHGFIKDSTSTDSTVDVSIQMCLLDTTTGLFFDVDQIEVDDENNVKIYTDDNTLTGFVVIGINSKAYAITNTYIDASQITGLADVATTGDYNDLVNTPTATIAGHTTELNNIKNGTTVVAHATLADTADLANYLSADSKIQGIKISDIFETGSSVVKKATEADNYNTTSGTIKTKFDSLAKDVQNTLLDYYKKTDTVTNAAKVNNLEIIKDANGILKIGNIIIPQKKLLWSGSVAVGKDTQTIFQSSESLLNKTLEVEVNGGTPGTETTPYYTKFFRFKILHYASGDVSSVEFVNNAYIGGNNNNAIIDTTNICIIINNANTMSMWSMHSVTQTAGNTFSEDYPIIVTKVYEIIE